MISSATPCVDTLGIQKELKEKLSIVDGVDEVRFHEGERCFGIWVGIREGVPAARDAVYAVEDEITEACPSLIFDFHVVELPTGKHLSQFVSVATKIFERTAA